MAEYFTNSTRSLFKATFESRQRKTKNAANVVEKKALLANWMVSAGELETIKTKAATLPAEEKKNITNTVKIIKQIISAGNTAEAIKLSAKLASADYKILVQIGQLLAELRSSEQPVTKKLIGTKSVTTEKSANPAAVSSEDVLNMTHAFEERMKKSQFGWLHLERLDMNPCTETEEGELLYSLPLAPNEKVTLSHKEWSSQSKDLEKVVTEVLETTEEQSVEDKRDSSMSTETQSQISTAFAVSGGYSGFGFSMSSSFGQNTNDNTSKKISEQHAVNLTKKSSARARKEHKTSIKVSSSSGLEDSSERIVENKYTDHVLQLDYHRLMRKWEVSLKRYGMRLAYDVVLPNPAKDIVAKHIRIKEIEDEMAMPFEFNLHPLEIRVDDADRNHPLYYLNLASKYETSIGIAPKAELFSPQSYSMPPRTNDDHLVGSIELNIPENNSIASVGIVSSFRSNGSDENKFIRFTHPDLRWFSLENIPKNTNMVHRDPPVYIEALKGGKGKFTVNFNWKSLLSLNIEIRLLLKLDDTSIEKWKIDSWQKLYVAAQEQHERKKQEFEEQKAKLLEEISADDALALRQREREEVMKRIISFLFGINLSLEEERRTFTGNIIIRNPEFNALVNAGTSESETAQSGEIINFLSHAIEWENVVYVLYPYFWANRENRKYKMFLNHPDRMHRDFLRAGAARVVLTIRRGYENAFVAAMNYGLQAGLATEFPEMTIGDELQLEAWKRYKDMPPEKGEHNFPPASEDEIVDPIATWHEYMPTSGVKVKATKIKVTEE
jgi:hypothetical protein